MSNRLQQPTQEDIVALAAAMLAEARGEGIEGMTAVGHVLANRARVAEISIPQVAYAQAQITGLRPGDGNRDAAQEAATRNSAEWQRATQLAQDILNGGSSDPTGGATYYYAPDVMREQTGRPDPYWGRGARGWKDTAEIGGHIFGTRPEAEARGVFRAQASRVHPPVTVSHPIQIAGPRVDGPDPTNDLNRQELAAFYPNPVPSPFSPRWDTPSPTVRPGAQSLQIDGSRNPFGVEGYEPPSNEVEVPLASSPLDPGFPTATIERDTLNFNDGMRSDPRGNYHNLTPEMQEMLATAMAALPQDLRDKVVITSTFRNDRFQNHLGDAIDIRNTNLSRQEEAQVAAAFARAGAQGIGVYRNDSAFDDHMHIDRTAKFGAVHSRSTRDNPYLGPVYNAMRSGDTSRLSLDLAQMGLPTLPNPVARPSNLKGPPTSTFPARPSTPAGLPAAPQRIETTPRLSERYAGSDSGSPVLPSSFPARPSMGTGGLPAARNDINGMRAQSEAIQRQTQRPSVPTPRISRPATPQRSAARSPTDFQYATRAPTPPPAPRTPAPMNAPQLGSQRGFFSDMTGADYVKPDVASAPRFNAPNPVPSPVARPTVPDPVARPSSLPQFGTVPNPVPRPNIPQFAGVPAPMPRSRFRQVPSPIAAPNAPRRQQAPLLDLAGFNNWLGGVGTSIGNALSSMVTMTPAMRNAPTRYAGDVVLPPQPAGRPTQLTPPNRASQRRAGVPNDDNSFVRSLFTRQPTNPSLNGRAQGPWNSRGGEGGFVW